jgi:hypothetical protein
MSRVSLFPFFPEKHMSYPNLYDGWFCPDCGWAGRLTDSYVFRGTPYCPRSECDSGYPLESCHLCSKCRDEKAAWGGECLQCHVHEYTDNECECGAIFRRDVA